MTQHQAELVPIDSLKPYKANPRRGDVTVIRESLRVNGQYRPVVVRAKTREVLAGNHTLKAAIEEGWSELWATFVDCDAKTARRIVLVDNRSNDVAGYDDSALISLLHELNGSYEGSGYDEGVVDLLIAEANAEANAGRDTDPGEVPAEPRTKAGDLYLLGEHRLVCGDATKGEDVERLLGEASSDLIVTDPPYGVAYQTKLSVEEAAKRHRRKDGLEVANDALTPEETRELWKAALALSRLKAGGAIYATVPSGTMLGHFIVGLDEGLGAETFRHSLVWVKDAFVMGRADYHYRHETILYGWRKGASHHFSGGRTQDTVWEIERPRSSKSHPTMKPVELAERCVTNSSLPSAVVLDPFAGSGSTLIAAENLGRRCYAMEIDPGYCDVIVDRWQRHTGGTAELAPRE